MIEIFFTNFCLLSFFISNYLKLQKTFLFHFCFSITWFRYPSLQSISWRSWNAADIANKPSRESLLNEQLFARRVRLITARQCQSRVAIRFFFELPLGVRAAFDVTSILRRWHSMHLNQHSRFRRDYTRMWKNNFSDTSLIRAILTTRLESMLGEFQIPPINVTIFHSIMNFEWNTNLLINLMSQENSIQLTLLFSHYNLFLKNNCIS